jgi:hypothetical protein
MSEALTGIELRPGSCVLTRVSRHGRVTRISAVHSIEPDQWPASEWLLGEELERARTDKKLPRHARVVMWGAPAAATADGDGLAAIRRAGFRIEAVLSPTQALALLAAERVRPAGSGAAAWLAVNRHGAALAIVAGGELLFSRVFAWAYRSLNRPQDQLLQRYSLVAHLAPELRHGIEEVRRTHGVTVGSIVTCGDLPDLRSLTMPLTEEFDVEVETLDSAEGLDLAIPAESDRGTEWLPAARLATATASARRAPDPRRAIAMTLTAAAAVVMVTAFGYWVYVEFVSPLRSARPAPSASRPAPSDPRPAPSDPRPVPSDPRPVPSDSRPAPSDSRSAPSDPRSAASDPPAASNAPTGTRGVVRRPAAAEPPRRQNAEVLTAPLPQVNSILVSPERRIAVLDGTIVREGEKIGPRVLVAIEHDAVVLREPSGRQVRLPIRGRRPGGG